MGGAVCPEFDENELVLGKRVFETVGFVVQAGCGRGVDLVVGHFANDAKAAVPDRRTRQYMAGPGRGAGSEEYHFAALYGLADVAEDDVTGCGSMRDVDECGDG